MKVGSFEHFADCSNTAVAFVVAAAVAAAGI